MPFALGQSIAALFARIAAALQSGGGGSISPLPPRPPSPPRPPITPGPQPGSPTPIPEEPYTPRPRPLPPPVVAVSPSPPVIPDAGGDVDCSFLSLSDRLALYGLQQRAAEQEIQQFVPSQVLVPEVIDVPQATNAGHLIEATDVFRFRAFSTSDDVTVSFFGRVMGTSGSIVPFNHNLRTATAGTIYETVVPAGRGMLLGAAASVPVNSITAGTVSAVGEIGRVVTGSFVPHTLLFSGQLDDLTPLTSASASVSAPVSAPTFIAATMAAFAAGTSTTTITPSAGRRIRICHISADYACSAVAGNRQLLVRLRNTAMTLHEGLPNEYITASQTGVYRASIGANMLSPAGALPAAFRQISIPLPSDLYFTTATDVLCSAYGIQAGDAPVAGFIRYEES